MAESSSSHATIDSNPQVSEPENPNSLTNQPESAAPPYHPPQSLAPTSVSVALNPNLHSPLVSTPQPPHSLSYAPPPGSGTVAVPPAAPSFRPVPLSAAQFSSMTSTGMLNPSYPNPVVQPPGVSSAAALAPGMVSGGTGAISVPVPQPMMAYQVPPGQHTNLALRPYVTMPNGFATMPSAAPQGVFPPPGMPRYPSPYPAMIRTPFPPRPPGAICMVPGVPRPPVPGIPGVRPIIHPMIRPAAIPSVTPAEKPQTTIYIGRIAQSVENDFILSLLQLCGPVKSWKRAQDPTDGTPRTFGFCEFESAEGVLRALRLLTKLKIDGQELVLKGTQATREYLRRYVEKKAENSKKLKESQVSDAKEGAEMVSEAKNETAKPSIEDSKEDSNDSGEKEDHDIANSAVLSDEDREADREASDKLTNAIEERLKSRPLPPPPVLTPADISGNSSAEPSAKLKDGESDADILKNDATDDRHDEDTTSDNKQTSEHDKPETSSPERSRRYDRRSRERDREREMKRDKEREIERYERETERERVRKEREQRRKIEEAERQYEECLKEWEYREREREKQRQYEKEREKEKERKRKKEILYDEDEEDDDSRRKWRRGTLEEKRKKRLREKEDDMIDRQKEEEEIVEAKRKAVQEQLQKQKDAFKLLSSRIKDVNEKTVLVEESTDENKVMASEPDSEGYSGRENHIGDETLQNGSGDEVNMVSLSEARQTGSMPAKRLGFGLVGSGKRTAVPSVFYEEEDDEAQKEKKMRPLVPIDYSAEELQAVQPASSGALPPNLAAAAEFAKRISNVNSKEDKTDAEKERGRRPNEKSGQRDKDRNDEDAYRTKDEIRAMDRDKDRDHVLDKVKGPDNKKLLDAKQLIDMIPKTKEELFSYDINWAIYEKHALHERMRPWISKKITEFLGEEETTLVDYIVSSTQEHVKASQMLELLQSILDEEAEMFVLKMWRMLIFEIKKVETGLAFRSKA